MVEARVINIMREMCVVCVFLIRISFSRCGCLKFTYLNLSQCVLYHDFCNRVWFSWIRKLISDLANMYVCIYLYAHCQILCRLFKATRQRVNTHACIWFLWCRREMQIAGGKVSDVPLHIISEVYVYKTNVLGGVK